LWQPFASLSNAVVGVRFIAERPSAGPHPQAPERVPLLGFISNPGELFLLVSAAGKAERLIIARMPSPRLDDLEERSTSLNSADK